MRWGDGTIEKRIAGEVLVKHFGSVRAAAGRAEERVPMRGGTSIYLLLQQLSGAHGSAFGDEIFVEGKTLRDDLTVAVNGTIIQHEAADETILRPEDTLALFPAFPGGG